jgi:predicted porin
LAPERRGVAVFISGDLGTLTLGDTDGALDWAMQEVDFNGAASINDDHTTHAGFNGNGGLDGHYDGQILRYDYSFGDFSVAVSVEQDDNTTHRAANVRVLRRWPAGGGNAAPSRRRTRSGASAPSTAACSLAAPSASASATSSPMTALTIHRRKPGRVRDRPFRQRRSRLRLLGGGQLLDDRSHRRHRSTAATMTAPHGHRHGYTFDAVTVHANYGVTTTGTPAHSQLTPKATASRRQYDFGGGLAAHLRLRLGRRHRRQQRQLSANPALGSSSTWSLGLSMSF